MGNLRFPLFPRTALRGNSNKHSEPIKSGEFRSYYEQQYGERLRAAG